MNVGTAMVLVVAALPLLAGAGLVIAGVASVRRSRREVGRRVAVEAVVVDHTFAVQPARVTFDYPVPGGWLRAQRVVGLPVVRAQGVVVAAGDRLTVYVDPARPHDVSLGPGSAATLGGMLMIGGGVVLGLGGLAIAAVGVIGAVVSSG